MDPFERAQHDSNSYYEWMEGVVQWAGMPAQVITGRMVTSFKDYPPRQRPASFNLDEVLQSLTAGAQGN
jgi:arylsulfatase